MVTGCGAASSADGSARRNSWFCRGRSVCRPGDAAPPLSAGAHEPRPPPSGCGGTLGKKQAARCNAPRVCAWRCQQPATSSGVAYPPHGRAATGHAAVLAAGTQGAWPWPLPWGDVQGLPPPRRGALVVKGGTVLTAVGASEVPDGGGRRRNRAWSPFASAVLGRSGDRGLVRGGGGVEVYAAVSTLSTVSRPAIGALAGRRRHGCN